MYNNLTFLNNPVNKAHLLIHLTIWTFSVDSMIGKGFGKRFEAFLARKVGRSVKLYRVSRDTKT